MGPRARAPDRRDERGIALLFALLFTLIVAGITMTGTLLLKSHIQTNRTSWASKNQALQVARSGLNEALAWLRRQTSQPVLAFAPQLAPSATPPRLDTLDPDIGLVREFKITGKVYARYEVWKQWDADPVPARLAWRQQFQCEDVSAARANAPPGTVWRLRSVGYIYNRIDPGVAYDVAPNHVIASQVAVSECRRLVIGLPGQAAVNVADGSGCSIAANGRVAGGAGCGIYYAAATGAPSVGPVAENRVTGTPSLATAVDYDDGYEAVFGVSYGELQAMATLVVTAPDDIPNPLPAMGLTIVDCGNVTLGATRPLIGAGIVIVRGDAQLSPGNNSNFSGLLYVDGSLTLRSPSVVNGSIVCTGDLTVQGAADYATVNYDGDILDELMRHLGNYRVCNTTLLPRHAR
jgi:hypothetical protein